jgi:hypothetical protein
MDFFEAEEVYQGDDARPMQGGSEDRRHGWQ